MSQRQKIILIKYYVHFVALANALRLDQFLIISRLCSLIKLVVMPHVDIYAAILHPLITNECSPSTHLGKDQHQLIKTFDVNIAFCPILGPGF